MCKFEVGDLVQFNNPPQYGLIKWIGILPGRDTKYAGVETVSECDLNLLSFVQILIYRMIMLIIPLMDGGKMFYTLSHS